MITAHPMDGALDFAVGTFGSRFRCGIVGAIDFFNLAGGFVLLEAGTVDNVGTFETGLLVGRHTEELLIGNFLEIGTFNPEFTAELDGVGAFLGALGVIDHLKFFDLSLGIVGNDEFDGVEYGRYTSSSLVEIGAHGTFEQLDVVERVKRGVSDLINELANALGAVTSTTYAANGGHTWIVPSADHAFFGEQQEVALGHEGVIEIQLVELNLSRPVVGEIFSARFFVPIHEKVVKRTVGHKFKGADGVGNPFEVVTLPMREIIHGVGVPLVAGADVRHVENAVHDGVPEVHIVAGHVDLGAKHHFAGFNSSTVHFFEQTQGLFHRSVAIGTGRAGTCGRALLRCDLLCSST